MKYVICMVDQVLVYLITVILAPLVVVFASTTDRKHLLSIFKWMETIDNDLSGDDGWKNEHLIGTDPLSNINRIRWLWRNGANYAAYYWFGAPVNKKSVLTIKGNPDTDRLEAGSCKVTCGEFWMYRYTVQIGNRLFSYVLGWNLLGPKQGRAKVCFSVRFSKKK